MEKDGCSTFTPSLYLLQSNRQCLAPTGAAVPDKPAHMVDGLCSDKLLALTGGVGGGGSHGWGWGWVQMGGGSHRWGVGVGCACVNKERWHE